jgi:hypothetical protein
MHPAPLTHGFWLLLASFVLFVLASWPWGPYAGPAPFWTRMQLGWLGAACIALALLWQ